VQLTSNISWLFDGSYEFTGVDAVYGLLLDNPKDFYITPNEQTVFVFLQGRGLVRIFHDFSGMTDRQINHFIYHIIGGHRG